jgi:hypothetical protein
LIRPDGRNQYATWIRSGSQHRLTMTMAAQKLRKIPYFSTPWKEVVNAMIYGNARRLCVAQSWRRAISTDLELAAA